MGVPYYLQRPEQGPDWASLEQAAQDAAAGREGNLMRLMQDIQGQQDYAPMQTSPVNIWSVLGAGLMGEQAINQLGQRAQQVEAANQQSLNYLQLRKQNRSELMAKLKAQIAEGEIALKERLAEIAHQRSVFQFNQDEAAAQRAAAAAEKAADRLWKEEMKYKDSKEYAALTSSMAELATGWKVDPNTGYALQGPDGNPVALTEADYDLLEANVATLLSGAPERIGLEKRKEFTTLLDRKNKSDLKTFESLKSIVPDVIPYERPDSVTLGAFESHKPKPSVRRADAAKEIGDIFMSQFGITPEDIPGRSEALEAESVQMANELDAIMGVFDALPPAAGTGFGYADPTDAPFGTAFRNILGSRAPNILNAKAQIDPTVGKR